MRLNEGTVYNSLLGLVQEGWISSEWGASDSNRKAKFYSITKTGRKQLAREAESWEHISGVIGRSGSFEMGWIRARPSKVKEQLTERRAMKMSRWLVRTKAGFISISTTARASTHDRSSARPTTSGCSML